MNRPPWVPISCIAMLLVVMPGVTVPRAAGDSDKKPFDLVVDLGRDTNGFPRNPRWQGGRPDSALECDSFPARWFKRQGRELKCTNDPVYVDQKDGSLICGPNRKIEGHINWGPATFDGCVRRQKSQFDGDITWDIETRDCRIITEQRKRSTLHCEADSARTVNLFDTAWWNEFSARRKPTVGRYAVISGLLNLDNVHKAYSELHPVYAFAVMGDEVCDDARCTETWGFFVRNWGDQGYCSTKGHHEILNLDRMPCGDSECVLMRIDVPLRGGTQPAVTPLEKFKSRGVEGAPSPRWEENNGYVTLEFALPPTAAEEGVYYGAFTLEVTRPGHDPSKTCAVVQTCPPDSLEMMALADVEPCTYEEIHEYLTGGLEPPPADVFARQAPPSRDVDLVHGRLAPTVTPSEKPRTRLVDPGLLVQIDAFTCNGVERRRSDLGDTSRIDACYPDKRKLKSHVRKMWKKCRKAGYG